MFGTNQRHMFRTGKGLFRRIGLNQLAATVMSVYLMIVSAWPRIAAGVLRQNIPLFVLTYIDSQIAKPKALTKH